eukprot:CAMPEP_0118854556 /NCGR_PEP_ID=MMETSP1163-20130328/2720_1 /TAXON_ID=124430 /ORGANISM="Phaeomonas parva, Strain CCMP2877" /LENGTH=107 /DNA_ID=CAMNT_0006787297 /DNA_START=79 /DNA_END=402 /DNA_ORIENTATION=-
MNATQVRELVEGLRGKVDPERLDWIMARITKPTVPHDNRFPTQNQMNHCWAKYNEWVLCLKETEGDAEQCFDRRRAALAICPNHWTEKWDEGREEGFFPGVVYKAEE